MRDKLLSKISILKENLRVIENEEKSSIREIQISAVKAEILKIARQLERLDRSY